MGCLCSTVEEGGAGVVNEKQVDLSHFELQRVIGEGGFGRVNAAVMKTGSDAGRWFAIKQLRKERIVMKNSFDQVLAERQLQTELQHPFVCNVHYAFQDEVCLYLVMDVALGGDLRYHLERASASRDSTHGRLSLSRQDSGVGGNVHCFPEERARYYIASAILALQYLHENGVLHRDMKPDNLLMDKDGRIMLTDFSVAERSDNLRSISTSGTEAYLAPEVFLRSHEHGVPAEAWSLGIVLFEFLTGSRPFSASDWRQRVARQDAAKLQDPELLKFVRKRVLIGLERCASAKKHWTPPSQAAVDLLLQLLHPVPEKRLSPAPAPSTTEEKGEKPGVGPSGSEQASLQILQQHPFFTEVDFAWEALANGTMEAPFIPDISRVNFDTGSIDLLESLAGETPRQSDVKIPESAQERFSFYEFNTSMSSHEGRSLSTQSPLVGQMTTSRDGTVRNTVGVLQLSEIHVEDESDRRRSTNNVVDTSDGSRGSATTERSQSGRLTSPPVRDTA